MNSKRKTNLTQKRINSTTNAVDEFNSENNLSVPLVLTVPRPICIQCYTVPSGISTIVETCGKDQYPESNAPAGLFCCKPCWNGVSYMITQQSCTYNAPVKACPTSDNVMVDVELTLVFAIGPDPKEVKNFIYKLGALKFNEYLAAECDESMRQLIRQTPLNDCYELRGSGSEHVQNVLQTIDSKFKEFGVHFIKAAIQDVVLNQELRGILQGTTEFRTKVRELDKEHEHHMKLIGYDYQQKLSERERFYDRKIQDLEAEIQILLVNRQEQIVQAEMRREVQTTNEREGAETQKKRAQSHLAVSTYKARMENEDLLAKVKADSESKKIMVDKETEAQIYESKQMIKVSENQALALKTESKAEGDAAEALEIIRDHNLEMAKLEVTESIAKTAKMVISGNNGDRLISSILDKQLLAPKKNNK